MNYGDADAFCKNVVGGRLILLKDVAYLDQFHSATNEKGWIGISRSEGSRTYEWSDGKTVFPDFNGFLSIGNTRACGLYDKGIKDVFEFDGASWLDLDCEEEHFAYCERVEVQFEEEIDLEQFKLFKIKSILPGTYTITASGIVNDETDDKGNLENSFNLRIWAATYMPLGTSIFQNQKTEQVSLDFIIIYLYLFSQPQN